MERRIWHDFDYLLLAATLILAGFGAAMIYSATFSPDEAGFLNETVTRQLLYLGVGLVAMVGLTVIDYHIFARLSRVFYGLALVLLLATIAVGQVSMGAQRWIATELFPIQTSEPVKILLIVVLAKFLSDHRASIGRARIVLGSLALIGIPLLLVYLQPNLSTALVLLTIWAVMALMAGLRIRHVAFLALVSAAAAPLAWLSMKPYMRDRILVFLDPARDPIGAGYNPIQALVSVGSGGWFGKGFASGTQSQLHFLRVRHTDFIFSVTCEELGFVGALVLFCLLAIILFRIVRAGQTSRDVFGQQIAIGVATVILVQGFANMGMNLGLLPATGVPLPFFSAGGSSLITLFAAQGLIQSILTHQRPLDFWSRDRARADHRARIGPIDLNRQEREIESFSVTPHSGTGGRPMVNLAGRDIISAAELSPDEILHVMATAERFERAAHGEERSDLLAGRVLASLFYEPSTRTRLSFESAMLRLGGKVISVAEIRSSSAAKGESLADMVRTVESYSDVIALRHPKEGAAQLAADSVRIPVINAGDGAGHHPTQALLDLYTMRKERGGIEGLEIVLLGDLRHGRTVHSLVHVLSNFGVSLRFVAPPDLAMPLEVTWILKMRGVPVEETQDLEGAVQDADIIYVTRLQEERFADRAEYERLKGSYSVDLALLERAKPGVTIMHPLPRTDEIAPEVDDYTGAAYFRQVANGLPIRMALLALVLGEV